MGELKEKSVFSWREGTPQFMHFISQGQMQSAEDAEYWNELVQFSQGL